MRLPFTELQFLELFARYNTAIWPMQIVLAPLALAIAVLAWRGGSGRAAAWWLAAQWAWTGIVYHWLFFSTINPAARLFAALWLAGAATFAWHAFGCRTVSFRTAEATRFIPGAALIVYALLLYPALGYLGGRVYPHSPTFGAPCPVTIFTIGILWLAKRPVLRLLVIAPLVWAAIGGMAAFTLGVYEDLGLIIAGLSSVLLLLPGRAAAASAEYERA